MLRDRVPAAPGDDARPAGAGRRSSCSSSPAWVAGRSGVLLAGVLAALLAPFQFFAFPATYLIVGCTCLTTGALARPDGRRATPCCSSRRSCSPPRSSPRPSCQQGDVGAFRFVAGWSEARFGDGPLGGRSSSTLTNLGIPFALALVAAVDGTRAADAPVPRRLARRALRRARTSSWSSAVEFDMNKYFQIMWIAVAILAAWLIRRWPTAADRGRSSWSCALSPALIAVWHMTTRRSHWARPGDAPAAGSRPTPRTDRCSSPTRSSTARSTSPAASRITTFGPYVSNLGYDPAPREADTTGDLLRRPGRRGRASWRRTGRRTSSRAAGCSMRRRRADRLLGRATGSRRSTTRTASPSGGSRGPESAQISPSARR